MHRGCAKKKKSEIMVKFDFPAGIGDIALIGQNADRGRRTENNKIVLLRGTIVNRTYGTLKNLHTRYFPFPVTLFDPIYYGPP